jgi:hypothetical protein
MPPAVEKFGVLVGSRSPQKPKIEDDIDVPQQYLKK